MDGTLFDTERIAIDAVQSAFREQGVEVTRQTLETVIGGGGDEARAFLNRFVPARTGIDEILQRTENIMKGHIDQHGLPIKAGALELLAYLKNRGITVGLATSSNSGRARDNLKLAGMCDYFETVIGGDQVERCKPHPDIYLKALAELRAIPGDTIALEDSDNGIKAAFAAGLRVIHIPDIQLIDEKTRTCVYRQFATLLEFREEIAV
jgi:HAD superfamily hydrolase (TIGR01509 family)